jgi:hypothetical protein
MEIFGGVPQFMTAFGYGPDGEEGAAATTSWVDSARRLLKLAKQSRQEVTIEHVTESGTLERHGSRDLVVRLLSADLVDNAATFEIENYSAVVIPFVDVPTVYNERGRPIVRTSGVLRDLGGGTSPGKWKYTASHALSQPTSAAMSTAFSEFVADLMKNHQEITLTVLEGAERRVYTGQLAYNIDQNAGMIFMMVQAPGAQGPALLPIPKTIITGWTPETGDHDYFRRLIRLGYADGSTSWV